MISKFGNCKTKHSSDAFAVFKTSDLYDQGCDPIELPKPCPKSEPCEISSSTE